MAGEKYEYEPEEENPHEADYFLRGSAEELAAVKTLVDELTQKYGDDYRVLQNDIVKHFWPDIQFISSASASLFTGGIRKNWRLK
jgi:hypothetical protein